MKLTIRQRRYLDACQRGDWTLFNKTGTPEIRRWARQHALIQRPTTPGSRFALTKAGVAALAANPAPQPKSGRKRLDGSGETAGWISVVQKNGRESRGES